MTCGRQPLPTVVFTVSPYLVALRLHDEDQEKGIFFSSPISTQCREIEVSFSVDELFFHRVDGIVTSSDRRLLDELATSSAS